MADTISSFVSSNRSLFEDVMNAKGKGSEGPTHNVRTFTILNYDKILTDMCSFITGYTQYKEHGSGKHDRSVLDNSRVFYDGMFSKKEYRKEMILEDFPKISKTYLQKTKQLQDLINKNRQTNDRDFKILLSMSENQYRKIGKVFKDDVRIWFHLKYGNSLSSDLRNKYMDKTTPVIHKKGKDSR